MSNRLINEKSPYLLLHAENPVDWYPWSDEAKQKAVIEDKPLFLSIGYSSCHWCHVIARESFEDAKVAEVLNRAFVPVKVDKEERPDLDAVYMAACQAMTGSGGWPLTVLATPAGVPFFAATYLPKEDLLGLLNEAERLWNKDREKLIQAAERLQWNLQAEETPPKVNMDGLAEIAYTQFSESFDRHWGGFGQAPKFPAPQNLLFLLAYYRRTGEAHALEMVERTLEGMFRGGIFDHVGGGFCRYSTDGKWLIPHFEKMLYDNALLLWAYSEAYEITGRAMYRRVGEQAADFVLRELTGPRGEFFGSLDADSEGGEGAYYALTPGELESLLGPEDGKIFCQWFNITETGNFEGKSIPNLLYNHDAEMENTVIEVLRKKVYAWRKARMPLRRDDKVLTSWNALMIAALARVSRAFEREDYLSAADRAAGFLLNNLRDKNGRLLIRLRDGEAKFAGIADDYAFSALAFWELGQVDEAKGLIDILLEHFSDRKKGGFHLTADDAEPLYIRPKEIYDGAMPSGNSATLVVLRRLRDGADGAKWDSAYESQRRFMTGEAARWPSGIAFALSE
jgi:uncharacterized protein YyaL (SSP411 family)